jgi:hypothetical protein
MSCDHGDVGDRRALRATALCLHPSAIDPPPIYVLLKTKGKVQFDWTVDRAVEALFFVFQGFNPIQFQALLAAFTVRSAEGCNASPNTGVSG